MHHFYTNPTTLKNRINQLVELDETKRHAFDHLFQRQENTKKKFDKQAR
jgi:hypothetical protein